MNCTQCGAPAMATTLRTGEHLVRCGPCLVCWMADRIIRRSRATAEGIDGAEDALRYIETIAGAVKAEIQAGGDWKGLLQSLQSASIMFADMLGKALLAQMDIVSDRLDELMPSDAAAMLAATLAKKGDTA